MIKVVSILVKVLLGLVALLLVAFTTLSFVGSPGFAWRVLTLGQSDTGDIDRFPVRIIEKGNSISALGTNMEPIPLEVKFPYKGQTVQENLNELIKRTDTSAFMIVKNDKVIMQVFPNGESTEQHTSFSVAKSFDSAMIGAAIQDGFIISVDDLVIKYIPELKGRGLDELTIRNLLRMDTGIKYIHNYERPFYEQPFGDDALTYYSTDLRKIALNVQPSGIPIGEAFRYNNYHPLLEGLIIERATGMHVADYLSERIWKPLGAEFDASWSLDSDRSGFEKMESGVNAVTADFARFGLLYLHNGFYNGTQILPEQWVKGSTMPDPSDMRKFETMTAYPAFGGYYGYHWWGLKNADGSYDYAAQGNFGQIIYVSPRANTVIVRLGNEPDPNLRWMFVLQALINQMTAKEQ